MNRFILIAVMFLAAVGASTIMGEDWVILTPADDAFLPTGIETINATGYGAEQTEIEVRIILDSVEHSSYNVQVQVDYSWQRPFYDSPFPDSHDYTIDLLYNSGIEATNQFGVGD